MAQSVVIATPSYLIKRGITTIIQDIVDAELVYIDELNELNNFLESNKVTIVIIEQEVLNDKEQRDLFFQLKHKTTFVGITNSIKCMPGSKKFDHLVGREAKKDEIVPLLEGLFKKSKESDNASSLLSEREVEVLKLVALGNTNQQIADKLFISKHTVISHRKNITSKLGIKTVSGLTVYAVLNNLIPKDHIQ